MLSPVSRRFTLLHWSLALLLGFGGGSPARAQPSAAGYEVLTEALPATRAPAVVANFEGATIQEAPDNWVYVTSRREIWTPEQAREPGEQFFVAAEDGNQFIRFVTENEAQRYSQRNGHELDWSLSDHSRLRWRWRAHHLPEGASEKGENDTGAALYVTFGTDWLGRPKSIKYTYSSSLPVGTVVDFGVLYVIVVDSAHASHLGEWKTVERNVRDDYRHLFGGTPPDRPLSITIWSDSDTTGGTARADFDDILLLPSRGL